MSRPRSFCWMPGLRGPAPQIVFDDPRVGGIKPLAEIKIEPGDTRSLDQLARDYPVPKTEMV